MKIKLKNHNSNFLVNAGQYGTNMLYTLTI